MEDIKISVIIPIFNMEQYLAECIDSIIYQDYCNLEIILINDGSTDTSRCICEKYAARNNNIIICNQENRGVSAARNKGLELATGDCISFVDPDDSLDLRTYHEVISIMQDINADICFFEDVEFETVTPPKKDIKPVLSKTASYTGDERIIKSLLHTRSACKCIFNRKIVNDLLFSEKYKIGEDTVFLVQALVRTEKVSIISEAFYRRRKTHNSATRSSYKSSWLSTIAANQEIENILLTESKDFLEISNYIFYKQSNILIVGMKNSYKTFILDAKSIQKEFQMRMFYFFKNPYLNIKEKLQIISFGFSVKLYYKILQSYKILKRLIINR